jgi:drug/metabolite transporter (DMT)-like permease
MGRVHDIISFPWQSYAWLSLAGIIHFVGGRSLGYAATQLLGANIGSVMGRVAPIAAVTLGISLLGEPLTGGIIAGVLLIVGGVSVAGWKPEMPGHGSNPPSHLPLKGILFGLGSGLCFGTTPLLVKMGLHEPYSPVAATFISYFAATIVLSAFLLSRGRRTTLFGMGNSLFLLFFLAGMLTSVAQLSRYIALSTSAVSIVSPLISTSPIFVLVFSFLFNRKLEAFNRAIILGAIATVVGAIVLT